MELESLIVKLQADISQFKNSLEDAEKSASTSGGKISSNWEKSTKMLGGIAVAGFGAIVGAGTAAVATANNWNEKLDEVMDKTGATSGEAAGLISMQERLGGSSSELAKMLVFMGKDVESSKGAIASLGIATTDASGNMLSSTAIFQGVADKLATMPDGIEKTNLMMQIFGKTGGEAGDLLNEAANGGLQSYIDRAGELGLATDPESTIAFGKAQADLKQTIDGLTVSLGTQLLPALTPLITTMADLAAKYLPPVVEFITKNMIPILGVLAVAFTIWAVNAAIAAWATISAMLPVIAIVGAIMAVVALLVAAWTNDWGGIRTFMTDLWDNKLKPIFDALKLWFETNIPKAIQVLVDFWNNKLKPVVDGIKGAFEGIGSAIGAVIDWVQKLIDKFKNIKLPGWLTPGSPTPFEMGLRGIGKAMKDVNNKALPEFTSQLNVKGSMPVASTVSNNNSELAEALAKLSNQNGYDERKLAVAIRDAMLLVMG